MNLKESIVEAAALEWFGEQVPQSREVGRGPQVAPGEAAVERSSFSEVMQSRCARTRIPAFSQREKEVREVIQRMRPAIPFCGLSIVRDPLLAKLSSVAEVKSKLDEV
jgi:hypothetical protein